MESVPIDAFHVWIALGIAAAVTVGGALEVPTHPPPDARAVAEAVDYAAASPTPTTETVTVAATRIRIGPRRVALRANGGRTAASFASHLVVPVTDGPLRRVLVGTPPAAVFDSPSEFREMADRARRRPPQWEPTTGTVRVRAVHWRGVDVILVGA